MCANSEVKTKIGGEKTRGKTRRDDFLIEAEVVKGVEDAEGADDAVPNLFQPGITDALLGACSAWSRVRDCRGVKKRGGPLERNRPRF